MLKPKVTICIPHFNRSNYLREMLGTIQHLKYDNLEVILIDNCSTDDSLEVASSFEGKIKNFKIIKNESNIGSIQNLLYSLTLGTGDFIAAYHSDDLYHPEIIERCVEQLLKYPQAGAVVTKGFLINEKSEATGKSFEVPRSVDSNPVSYKNLLESVLLKGGNYIPCPSVMMRRSILEKIEINETDLSWDIHLWLSIAKRSSFIFLKENLFSYRIHKDQLSQYALRERTNISPVFSLLRRRHLNSINEFQLDDSFHSYIVKAFIVLAIKRAYFKKRTYISKSLRIAFTKSSLIKNKKRHLYCFCFCIFGLACTKIKVLNNFIMSKYLL